MPSHHRLNGHAFGNVAAAIIAGALLLGGCAMPGANQATPTPVALPTYAATGANAPAAGAANAPQPVNATSSTAAGTDAATTPATAQSTSTLTTTGATADALAPATPAAERIVALASAASSRYPAEIAADKQIVVMPQVAGQVMEVLVDVGSHVNAGDTLVRIDSSALEAQRAQALAQLEGAKSQLQLLQDPAKDKDIAAAKAAVAAASAAYDRANNGPTDEERRMALAQVKISEVAITVAQAAYNQVKGNPNIGMMPQSLQLEQATLANEAAKAQYDKAMKGATADQIAGAYAQLANASAALQRLLDGAKPAQVSAAEAQVHAAETALYLSQLQLNKATITAPMDGTVSKLQTAEGSMAAPTAPLLTLLSDNVRITIPVEETRLPQLKLGQPVVLRVQAYPDRTFNGQIAIIAPELDPTTRTVQVTIVPTDADGLLHPGMSATAELLAQ